MTGGERKVVTHLRVITIKPRDMKITSYRIEMKRAEPRLAPIPYVHHTKR